MATQAEAQWTSEEMLEVAKRQKQILWMILLSLVAMFIPFATIVTGIIQIYFLFKLAQAVRSSAAWVYIICVFRAMPTSRSEASRPPNPKQADGGFRRKPTPESEASRPAIPAGADQPGVSQVC